MKTKARLKTGLNSCYKLEFLTQNEAQHRDQPGDPVLSRGGSMGWSWTDCSWAIPKCCPWGPRLSSGFGSLPQPLVRLGQGVWGCSRAALPLVGDKQPLRCSCCATKHSDFWRCHCIWCNVPWCLSFISLLKVCPTCPQCSGAETVFIIWLYP